MRTGGLIAAFIHPQQRWECNLVKPNGKDNDLPKQVHAEETLRQRYGTETTTPGHGVPGVWYLIWCLWSFIKHRKSLKKRPETRSLWFWGGSRHLRGPWFRTLLAVIHKRNLLGANSNVYHLLLTHTGTLCSLATFHCGMCADAGTVFSFPLGFGAASIWLGYFSGLLALCFRDSGVDFSFRNKW